MADGEFFGDALEELVGGGGKVLGEGAAQVKHEVFRGAAVFAVHQPKASGPVKEKVNFGMGLAGADVWGRFDFEAKAALDGVDAEFEEDGGGGEFEVVAGLGCVGGGAAGGEVVQWV